MQTLLGTSYSRPTPDEMQALVRQAHVERAQVLRQLLAAALGRRTTAARDHKGVCSDATPSLRPAA